MNKTMLTPTDKSKTVPEPWIGLIQETRQLAGRKDKWNNACQPLRHFQDLVNRQRSRLAGEPPVPQLAGTIPEISRDFCKVIRQVRDTQTKVLKDLEEVIEDFTHALENEDRFIILVFGKVNSGKSALANHMAGLDFSDLGQEERGECFVDKERVVRLAEKATECTRHYQGFRLPGLLWIDCPGVGSMTAENAELARRLVARADIILFVSSSDAPLTKSETEELRGLVEKSGNQALNCLFVITKSDKREMDEDPDTGDLVYRLVPKSSKDREAQARWAKEPIEQGGLERYLSSTAVIHTSVYLAREALGRNWETGEQARPAAVNWRQVYEESGIPELCRQLADIVRRDGIRLKREWPRKRLKALRTILQLRSDQTYKRVVDFRQHIERERTRFLETRERAIAIAAEYASGRVPECLRRFRIDDVSAFDRQQANVALRELVQESVHQAFTDAAGEQLSKALDAVRTGLQDFIKGVSFDLNLRIKTRKTVVEESPAPGMLSGLLAGLVAGSFFGILGVILATVCGAIIGGSLGSRRKETEVPDGTNADEVIAETRRRIKRPAKEAMALLYRYFDEGLFLALDKELRSIEGEIRQWPEVAVN